MKGAYACSNPLSRISCVPSVASEQVRAVIRPHRISAFVMRFICQPRELAYYRIRSVGFVNPTASNISIYNAIHIIVSVSYSLNTNVHKSPRMIHKYILFVTIRDHSSELGFDSAQYLLSVPNEHTMPGGKGLSTGQAATLKVEESDVNRCFFFAY